MIVKGIANNESGFILVWALLLLIIVTLLGASGISTSIFEERMAANEALHKQAFYAAEGGAENALALLVENINCISGFTRPGTSDGDIIVDGNVLVTSEAGRNFWLTNNETSAIPMPTDPSEGTEDRDFYYPANYNSGPHTNGKINGTTQLVTGANLPMLAGYEGKAKSMGSEGAFLQYDIKVEHFGERNSRVGIHTKFRLDNQFASYPAGECVY